MGPQNPVARCTPQEYLRREFHAVEKHQYFRDEVFSMAGGTADHSLITANAICALGNALKGRRCRVCDSNLRVRVERTMMYTYPDASVICGPVEHDPIDENLTTILNPTVLIEVLSPSSEAFDRGEKFLNYAQIDSFKEYLLISQHTPRAETFTRRDDGSWLVRVAAGLESIVRLASLSVELKLAEIYDGVAFDVSAQTSGAALQV